MRPTDQSVGGAALKGAYVGIDNGARSGAIAILRPCNTVIVQPLQTYGIPKSKNKQDTVLDDIWLWELLQAEVALSHSVHVVVERAQKFSPGKMSLISTNACWASIRTVLRLLGKLTNNRITFSAIDPVHWQREMLAGIVRQDPSDTGPASIAAAKALFPGVSLRKSLRCTTDHDGMSDALLIAAWGRRKNL